MRYIIGVLALSVLAGCGSPPKPRSCEGEFRPVNNVEQKGAALARTPNFAFCKAGGAHA